MYANNATKATLDPIALNLMSKLSTKELVLLGVTCVEILLSKEYLSKGIWKKFILVWLSNQRLLKWKEKMGTTMSAELTKRNTLQK